MITEEGIEELKRIYQLSEKEYKEYCEDVEISLMTGKRKNNKPKLIIVGGQSGAGKSRLIPIAYSDLNKDAVIIDFDELRAKNPNFNKVNRLYPEYIHRILHKDTNKVKEEMFKYAIKNKYNVVYEGALRDTKGFSDLAKKFKENDYDVILYIMAVCQLESYGSTFLRYAIDLLQESKPRWVEKQNHDNSYTGVILTTKEFLKNNLCSNTKVFIRGEQQPELIYSGVNNTIQMINHGRECGEFEAIKSFEDKYNIVKEIFKSKEPELLEKLSDWKQRYEEEKYKIKNRGIRDD